MGLWKVSETKAGKSHQIQGHPGQIMPQEKEGRNEHLRRYQPGREMKLNTGI